MIPDENTHSRATSHASMMKAKNIAPRITEHELCSEWKSNQTNHATYGSVGSQDSITIITGSVTNDSVNGDMTPTRNIMIPNANNNKNNNQQTHNSCISPNSRHNSEHGSTNASHHDVYQSKNSLLRHGGSQHTAFKYNQRYNFGNMRGKQGTRRNGVSGIVTATSPVAVQPMNKRISGKYNFNTNNNNQEKPKYYIPSSSNMSNVSSGGTHYIQYSDDQFDTVLYTMTGMEEHTPITPMSPSQ